MAWSGQPVLALLDPAQIPAVPASSMQAIAGYVAGFLAAVRVAMNHNVDGELLFAGEVTEARKHPDYDYSRGFLAGVELAKTELPALAAAPKELTS